MRLWTHLYQILPPGSLKPRSGLLIKLKNGDDAVGFADLMSWPELGDRSLPEELAAILKNKPTALGSRVLAIAQEDAEARKNKISFWNGLQKVPPSHYLVGNLNDLSHFNRAELKRWPELNPRSILKAKVEGEVDPQIILQQENLLRLDFNEKGTLDSMLELFSSKDLTQKIDFLEDPFSADRPEDWQIFKNEFPEVKLFGDYALSKNPDLFSICDGVVLKPASRCELNQLKRAQIARKKIVVTHSMGHMLGHSVSAYFAACNHVESTGLWPSPPPVGCSFDWNNKSPGLGYGWQYSHFERLTWKQEEFLQ